MPLPAEPRFSIRRLVLIALALALIGLAMALRVHDGRSGSFSLGQLLPTTSDWKLLSSAVCVGLLILLAVALGSFCGYLRVIFRLRKTNKAEHQDAGTTKI
jgi:hypothetical protein